MKKISILGTEYTIEELNKEVDKELIENDGYIIFYNHKIVIDDLSQWGGGNALPEEKQIYKNQVLRHEIIHAYLYESGLAFNSNGNDKWAMNEEMVDWLVIQFPKITKTFEELDILFKGVV